ncbi:MAG: DUF1254 domain-containing protein [Hyphomicrobiaceae bacterium]
MRVDARRTFSRHVVLLALALAVGGGHVQAQDTRPRIEDFRLDLSPAAVDEARVLNARSLATQAYLWGLPAFLYFRQTTEIKQGRLHAAPGEEPFGGWILLRKLASPSDRTNVMPNVDTLYGAAYLLLDKQGPVVLSIPRVKDRYYSVALHDAYFNTFAVVGTRTTNGDAANILILPPDHRGPPPAGFTRVIRAPTRDIALFQRVFVRDAADVAAVHSIQDRIRLAPLSAWKQPVKTFPRVDSSEFDVREPVRQIRDPLTYFAIVNAHTCRNRPAGDYAALVSAMSQAGLGPCASLPDTPAVRNALADGARGAQEILNARLTSGEVRNGWRIPDPNTGRASPDYIGRAVVQITQIASFSPDEAMYFTGRLDKDGAPLDGRNTYELTFPAGGGPPVDPRAFWSLTLYDAADNLLVANPIDRYLLRPTTPGLKPNPDGSLTLYVGSRKPAAAPAGNWLPAPEGRFIVVLRTYMPSRAVQTGQWIPPPLVRQ